ncbi:MAG: EamA family transporter [Ignavibacteriaceae bacterium]|nr:EamA family transporter [Ignavibacteriaceae bacterium]
MNSLTNILYYIIICLIWGSTWLFIRISLKSFPPFFSAGLRFLAAALIIYFLMKLRKVPFQMDRQSMFYYTILSVFSFVIPFGLVYWGGQYVTSGLSAVLFAVFPFFVSIFSVYMLPAEEIGAGKFVGMMLGFFGVSMMFYRDLFSGIDTYLLGMLAVVLSAGIQAWIAVFVKKYCAYMHPLGMNLVPMAMSAVIYLVVSPFIEDMGMVKFDLSGIAAVLYLGVFGSVVTFTLYYYLIKRVNIILLSLIAFITPVIALILGWIIESERLSHSQQLGSVMILAGIIFANLYKTKVKKV